MSGPHSGKVTVSRRIEAPAAELFAILADPARHEEFDGSGMLRGLSSGERVSALGDVFTMKMHRDDMGEYEMANHVIDFEPERRITWEPVPTSESAEPGRYRWGYELSPDGTATVVTEMFDCSRSPDWLREATEDGFGWEEAMCESLDKLAALAGEPAR